MLELVKHGIPYSGERSISLPMVRIVGSAGDTGQLGPLKEAHAASLVAARRVRLDPRASQGLNKLYRALSTPRNMEIPFERKSHTYRLPRAQMLPIRVLVRRAQV